MKIKYIYSQVSKYPYDPFNKEFNYKRRIYPTIYDYYKAATEFNFDDDWSKKVLVEYE